MPLSALPLVIEPDIALSPWLARAVRGGARVALALTPGGDAESPAGLVVRQGEDGEAGGGLEGPTVSLATIAAALPARSERGGGRSEAGRMAMEARIGAWVAADVTAAWVAARQGGDIEARTRWAVALAGSGMTWTGRAAADDEALALAVPEILRLLAARVESDGVRALWSGATGAVVRYLQREARPTEGGGWRRVRPGDGGLDGPIIRELVRGSASGRGRGGGRGG